MVYCCSVRACGVGREGEGREGKGHRGIVVLQGRAGDYVWNPELVGAKPWAWRESRELLGRICLR